MTRRVRAAASRRTSPLAVKIDVTHPSLIEDLADSLQRGGFEVAQAGDSTLDVIESKRPQGWKSIRGATELEIDLYLHVWELMHPGVRAVRVGD